MKADFMIDCDNWIADAGPDAEGATLTCLVIRSRDRVLTRLEDLAVKTNRDGPWASAYRLALWLASNWWRLRHEPEAPGPELDWRMSHQIGAAGGGYVWPDLTMTSDGAAVELRCAPTEGGAAETVRYLNGGKFPVTIEGFEQGVDDFINKVLVRLLGARVREDDLQNLWRMVCEERKDETLSEMRSLEALLGYDRDEAPGDLLKSISERGKILGICAAREVVAADPKQGLAILDELGKSIPGEAQAMTIPEAENLRKEISGVAGAHWLPWRRAEAAARIAQITWKLDPAPIADETLAGLFGVDQNFIQHGNGVATPLSVGYRDGITKIKVVLKKTRRESRRFMLARLVADNLNADMNDRLLPATGARTARQKFQRAFAHELLCPYEQLKEFIGRQPMSQDLIEEAAEHFMVSPLLVENKLADKGHLDREYLPDY